MSDNNVWFVVRMPDNNFFSRIIFEYGFVFSFLTYRLHSFFSVKPVSENELTGWFGQ